MKFEKIGVIGAGTMGSGIAQVLLKEWSLLAT
jgi:3-hydroxyacyl-CoA dehydrogenase